MTLADYRKKAVEDAEEPDKELGEHHPTALQYTQIGAILFIITAVEVALYYIDLEQNLLITILLVLSAAKFIAVVMWFMHLKFDNQLFSTLFVSGFLLALSIFAVVMATLGAGLI